MESRWVHFASKSGKVVVAEGVSAATDIEPRFSPHARHGHTGIDDEVDALLAGDAVNRLLAGYKRFRATGWPQQRRRFETLAEQGQKPKALVLACVDSRVDPAIIFDTAPGEVLTVRNVANLVPPYAPDSAYHGTSAALEFGVNALEVPHLIVLGHGLCGGVKALIEGAPSNVQEFVGPWMSIAEHARERAMCETDPEARQKICEYEVVKVSLANLMSFPWISERVAAGALQLHGAWFNIHTGTLLTLRPDGTFAPPE